MAKLQDMFTQAHRAQSGGGMGFVGKNRAERKARAAALVVEQDKIAAGSAEAALKAGADGILFKWDGKDTDQFDTLKKEIEAAKAQKESTVTGLHITEGLDGLTAASLRELKDVGVQYIILPFNAPARLLALETKDLEKVIVVPMREDENYPLYIRNLTAFEHIAAVLLDFGLTEKVGQLTIEEILGYRAVREAVRFPAFIYVNSTLSEEDAYTINTLGIQAVILAAKDNGDATRQQIKSLSELLEKVHQDESDKDTPSLPSTSRK
ncbi:hypothetical protein [Dictyobacter formicarum]|uniref:Indole-3-glycerol-phosphate synthase n=1 Tax=Dictyobacter formicarum TaxID=2778368 RepID=A0ABQ3VBP9_9CHLR|nr:hypothetical protein [Dictyobacter formicarum]GHO83078.1 hypothetical protein KSZ_10840 [Dictyobacter formicarum]